MKLAIVDYGMGNLFSVMSALNRAAPEVDAYFASTAEQIHAADRVILPGQGAIKGCMTALQDNDLLDAIKSAAAEKPFFGMCLGPQAMLSSSEENGDTLALDLIPGKSLHLNTILDTVDERLKIPHMGWNQVQHYGHTLWAGIPQDSWFYFVHSYFLVPESPDAVAASCDYGQNICVAIAQDNCFGVQFHPEKSAENGLKLLANFCHWQP